MKAESAGFRVQSAAHKVSLLSDMRPFLPGAAGLLKYEVSQVKKIAFWTTRNSPPPTNGK